MTSRATIALLLALVAGAAWSQSPVAVVERTVIQGEVATRVSLFSNRVVVVTIRRGDQQDFMRYITLPEEDYMVYLATFQTNADELSEKPVTSAVDTSHATVLLSLHIGPDAPRALSFSPMSTVKLPLARIMGAIDDLQLLVLESSPSAEAMRRWQPRKGDKVELMNGVRATVVEVWDDGLLILEHDRTYVRESVAPGLRDQVILRVVEAAP